MSLSATIMAWIIALWPAVSLHIHLRAWRRTRLLEVQMKNVNKALGLPDYPS